MNDFSQPDHLNPFSLSGEVPAPPEDKGEKSFILCLFKLEVLKLTLIGFASRNVKLLGEKSEP